MERKAQIQILETIAVLFIFFILIALGFIFYTKIFKSNLETEKEEFSQAKSVNIAQRAMFMPELQCSDDSIVKENCIDILKLQSAKQIIEDNIIYYDLLEFSDISIIQIYPNPEEWKLYSRTTGDFRNNFTANVPISLFNPITKEHGFGILTIQTLTR